MGSKSTTHMKAFVSSIKALYHEAMQLVLPLPKNGGEICKQDEKRTLEWQSDEKTSENEATIVK